MAKLLNQVIESEVVRTHEEYDEESDTVVIGQRTVKQYWTADGVFLAESDPYYCLCKVMHLEEVIDNLITEIKELEEKINELENELENVIKELVDEDCDMDYKNCNDIECECSPEPEPEPELELKIKVKLETEKEESKPDLETEFQNALLAISSLLKCIK